MAKQDDGLFLLEVLVDKVILVKSPCFSDKDFRTCVKIECPSVETLVICDDDPGSCYAKSGGPFMKTFNSGKSCLFSLKQGEISKAMGSFPIKITVYKSLPCGCLPTKIIIGEATIDMTKEFVQTRNKFLEDPTNVSYQALQDSFHITGPDGTEAGEVLMFLRISCFGKLIITKFQGGGGPPSLGTGAGSQIVDRSCNPPRSHQTARDPCVCGTAQSAADGKGQRAGTSAPCNEPCKIAGGFAVCPPARDPFISMPCEEDDPCYCSGPHPPIKQPMACRNMDQYCLHVPKGLLLSLPYIQDLKEELKTTFSQSGEKIQPILEEYYINIISTASSIPCSESTFAKESQTISKISEFSNQSIHSKLDVSICSLSTKSTVRSVSFSENSDYYSKSKTHNAIIGKKEISKIISKTTFGAIETAVYMTLFNDKCQCRTSGTQATASINKCLQVMHTAPKTTPDYNKLCSGSTSGIASSASRFLDNANQVLPDHFRNPDIYFFGKKKKAVVKEENSGMGRPKLAADETNSKRNKWSPKSVFKCPSTNSTSTQAKSTSYTTGAQTKKHNGSCSRGVCIRDDKRPCPGAISGYKDMAATVSHIRIGPKDPCPFYGNDPCQGPKCVLATTGAEDQAHVKVTSATNPRRGVFELVVRRINGAPLARNELMLEWTPPPYRPTCKSPCASTCPIPVRLSGCRPSSKMIVCRATTCKPSSCWKTACQMPCGPPSCQKAPCKRCYKTISSGSPCRACNSCRPCKPCPPPRRKPRCITCPPTPCSPCPPSPCTPCTPSVCKPTPRCRPCLPPRCSPCPPRSCRPCSPPRCIPCPPSRCRRCPPPRCIPCPAPRCRPCVPPRCRPCPPSRRRPCPPLRCRPCPPLRCRPCSPRLCTPCPPPRCRPCLPPPCGSCSLPQCTSCPPPRCIPCPPPRCRPCSPPRCIPCRPRRCRPSPPPCRACSPPPCCISPCTISSCSSPCFRPCPVGYKRPRRARSQPRARPHRKLISPCLNRSKACPVVRCRSVPGPCITCGGLVPCPTSKCCRKLPCPPRRCYSVLPPKPRCFSLLYPPRPCNKEFVCPPPKPCCL